MPRDYYFIIIIIKKAKTIVTLSRKNVTGALYRVDYCHECRPIPQKVMPCVVNAQGFLQCCVDFLINWHRLWSHQLMANLQIRIKVDPWLLRVKICPEFFDLYAGIYGSSLLDVNIRAGAGQCQCQSWIYIAHKRKASNALMVFMVFKQSVRRMS